MGSYFCSYFLEAGGLWCFRAAQVCEKGVFLVVQSCSANVWEFYSFFFLHYLKCSFLTHKYLKR